MQAGYLLACQYAWFAVSYLVCMCVCMRVCHTHTTPPQVPAEAAAFAQVDKTFKDIMRRTHDRPNALQVCLLAV